MHTYDVDSSERRNGLLVLVIPSLLAAYAFYVGASAGGPDWLWIVGVPSPLAILGVLYVWLDRWGWRSSWVRTVLGIRTPVLRGTWKGKVQSLHAGETLPIEVEIEQTWTTILLSAHTEESRSLSKTASILLNEGNHPIITYTYLNEPKSGARSTMQTHRGTATCYVDMEKRDLEGDYYTGRGRQTRGSIALQRV